MSIKLLIWDWNGTLLDDSDLTYSIENDMLQRRGMRMIPTKDEYLDLFGFPVIDYYRRLGYDFSLWPYPVLATEFQDLYADSFQQCALRTGAVQVLSACRSLQLRQIVLSATKQDRLEDQLKHFGVDSFFESVLGLKDDLVNSKTDIAKQYLSHESLRQNEILFIGDTLHDKEVATAVGAKCVLVSGGHQSRHALEKGGTWIIDELEKLIPCLCSAEMIHDASS